MNQSGQHYADWCKQHNTTHGHCPEECEHPQPVLLEDGRFVCGRCLFLFDEVREMVPCNEEIC